MNKQKLQEVQELYQNTIDHLSESPESWADLLTVIANNHKYDFTEQVLVFAQKPDATACADFEAWKMMERNIKKGSKSFQVLINVNGKQTYRNLFDVSDTYSPDKAPLRRWTLEESQSSGVNAELIRRFGLSGKGDLQQSLVELAQKLGSNSFTRAALAFVFQKRCGFSDVINVKKSGWNSKTAIADGFFISDMGKQFLNQIGQIVEVERSRQNVSENSRDTHAASGRSAANKDGGQQTQSSGDTGTLFGREPGMGSVGRQSVKDSLEGSGKLNNRIVGEHEQPRDLGRTGAASVQREESAGLSDHADGGYSDSIPGSSRQPSGGATGDPVQAVRREPKLVGGIQGKRSNGVGSEIQPDSEQRRGTGLQPGNLQSLTGETQAESQIVQKETEGAIESSSVSAGLTSQDLLDQELCRGTVDNIFHQRIRIFHYFQENPAGEGAVDFLKEYFGTGGHSPLGNSEYWVDHSVKGMTFTRGSLLNPDARFTLPWHKIADRIAELISAGRYLNTREREELYPQYLEYLDNREIRRQKESFMDSVADLPPNEKRDTLSQRLADFLNGLERYEKEFLGNYELSEFSDTNSTQVDALLQDPGRTQQMVDALAKIKGATCDVFTRNHAWRFGQELAELYPQRHVYYEGIAVYLDSKKYDIVALDDRTVRLSDSDFPLKITEFQREEFERKLAESPENEHLLRMVIESPVEPVVSVDLPGSHNAYVKGSTVFLDLREKFKGVFVPDAPQNVGVFIIDDIHGDTFTVSMSYKSDGGNTFGNQSSKDAKFTTFLTKEEIERYSVPSNSYVLPDTLQPQPEPPLPLVGSCYSIDGRLFEVDSVNEEWSRVTLRDVTFESGAGLPIFRDESLEFLRKYEPVTPERGEEQPSQDDSVNVVPSVPVQQRHNFCITDDTLGVGGAKTKFKANIAAIQLLKQIESENRLASPEEQEVLSRYVGWGGLSQAFDPTKKDWGKEFAELKSLLTETEYNAARATTLNAHYTSPTVIKAMWGAVKEFGFETGKILDPGCGVGNFQGLLPESMAASKVFGVELDSLTGRIARQLYQNNNIEIQGFEKTDFPDNFFDLTIGNVPFGDYKLAEKRYDKLGFNIHDHFIAKSLDKVRPGGIVAVVTSKGTMDKKSPDVRRYLAQRAELIGAIRLPNNAFAANAGTEVTSDILFLQKRKTPIEIDADWVHLGLTQEGIPVNAYFAKHPEMVLGTMTHSNRMYGNAADTTCAPFENSDLSFLLEQAIKNIHGEIPDYLPDKKESVSATLPADPTVRNHSYTFVDGNLYYRENGIMTLKPCSKPDAERIQGMINLAKSTRELIDLQIRDASESDISAQRNELNKLYDDFSNNHGLINDRNNRRAFRLDSSFPLLASLEVLDGDGRLKQKAAMFSKRTIRPRSEITCVETASEALAVSLAEKARVDLLYMSGLSGKSESDLIKELEGQIFKVPGGEEWVSADEYLSGDVKTKLEIAKEYGIPENVRALEQVIPKDLEPSDICVRLGATWIPPDIVQQFIYETLKPPRYMRHLITVEYVKFNSVWKIVNKGADTRNLNASRVYGTSRINAYSIIEETLNLRDIRITDPKDNENGTVQYVLNQKETLLAQEKQEQIKNAFKDWLWKDPDRRNLLCRLYNDKLNRIQLREYNGSHLTFPGMNSEEKMNPHQKNAVARHILGGNTLCAHDVGAGKTFTIIAASMESRRLGLATKPIVVVPNHLVGQWSAEWMRLYPAANILVTAKEDFTPENRKKFCARIATGDYDGVIISQSQFEKLPVSNETLKKELSQQLDELDEFYGELRDDPNKKITIKIIEAAKKRLEVKLEKLLDREEKDDTVTFEELGVDRLYVDESDMYKNLNVFTKMQNVGGISQSESRKASDMYMKCRYMNQLTNYKGIIFATGTPISNSMTEMFTVQRYLQPQKLEQAGLTHFDSWASTFGETQTAFELAPEGTGYRMKTRFSRFYNLPELMWMFRLVADIQTSDMLNLPVPKVIYETVSTEPSEAQKAMLEGLVERAEAVRARDVDPKIDNMLKITNDGRKLALEQRLMNPMLPDDPNSKVNACVDTVFNTWQRTAATRSAQIIFCDLSTPNKDQFNVYDDIKKKLMTRGVPESEIAFIHDADSDQQKKSLFEKVNNGDVRVILGSTQKLGAGTNIQKRLIAAHDLDFPWRPRDLVQRGGRIIRQGNDNPQVKIYRYVTKGTFDAYMLQLLESKQRYISQIMTSKSPARTAEDLDEVVLSFAEMKALSAGNPLIYEKMTLEVDLQKLTMLRRAHQNQLFDFQKCMETFPVQIASELRVAQAYRSDISFIGETFPHVKDTFYPMTIDGKEYSDRKEAAEALYQACLKCQTSTPKLVGTYRGFEMSVWFDGFSREHRVSLNRTSTVTASFGESKTGNLTRIDNVLDGLAERLERCQSRVGLLQSQMDTAKEDSKKPFPHEIEFQEKSTRLRELNDSLLGAESGKGAEIKKRPEESL